MNQIHSNDFSQEVTEMSSQKYPATILQNRMSLSLNFMTLFFSISIPMGTVFLLSRAVNSFWLIETRKTKTSLTLSTA